MQDTKAPSYSRGSVLNGQVRFTRFLSASQRGGKIMPWRPGGSNRASPAPNPAGQRPHWSGLPNDPIRSEALDLPKKGEFWVILRLLLQVHAFLCGAGSNYLELIGFFAELNFHQRHVHYLHRRPLL